jgi:hypothetical protein
LKKAFPLSKPYLYPSANLNRQAGQLPPLRLRITGFL